MGKRKEITGKDNGKQKMWIMITVIIVFFAMAGYAGMSYYYSDRFFRGTTINGINCSGKTSEEAEQAVAKKAEDYLLEVKARNLKSQSINGKLIGYRYVSDGSISQYLDEQKPYKWVRGFWKKQNYTAKENMTYDKVKLKEQMEKLECVKKENQTAPEDAYVAYKDSKFEIVPETEGNTLDFNGAYQALSEAITDKKRTIDLNSCPAVYVKAAVMKDDPDLKNSLEECQNLIRTKIVYIFGEETVTLEGDEIRNWLIFDERGRLQKNEDELRQYVAEYVAKLAATHDTVNTEREFCTTSGRTVQVYSSVYGWKIDQEKEIETIMQEMIAGVQINREPVYAMRANARGMNDIGSTYIEVDLSAQHLYYYQDGSIILESDIVSGDMQYAERQTPPGIFQLYYKKSPSVLKGKMLENGKGTYILHEELPPYAEGYVSAEDIEFEVKEDGSVTKVEMKDDYSKVEISKTDITTGEELEGAKLQILNKEGEILEEWVTDGKPHLVEKLPVGEELTLREITAPEGYEIAEDVKFTLEDTMEIQKVEMKDARTPETPGVPQTGDDHWKPILLFVLLGASAAGLMATMIYKKKHGKTEKADETKKEE